MVTTGQERNLTWMGHSLWTNLPKTMAYGNQDPAALPFLLLVIFCLFFQCQVQCFSFFSSILISFVVWLLTLLTPPPPGGGSYPGGLYPGVGAYIRGDYFPRGGYIRGLITETLPSLEATTGFSNKNRNIKYLFPSPQPPYDTKKLLRRSETGIKKALRNKL